MDTSEKIEKVCELEDRNECIELVRTMATSEELYALLEHYNWDDYSRALF